MSKDAAREFRKLDGAIQKRIAALVDKIEAAANPRFSGKALVGNDREGATASGITGWYAKSKTGS
jgi:mRNA-degrading endonuclease RelE of RelBE toxin-antitoxin system